MILPNRWEESMATPDLPLYGQICAYGIGAMVIGFGLKQISQGMKVFLETLFWLFDRIKER